MKHPASYWIDLAKRALGPFGRNFSDFDPDQEVTLNQFLADVKSTIQYDHEADAEQGIDH
jgi:hypothetical protein